VGTVNTVSNIGLHITLIWGNGGPFPGVFNTIGENNIIGSHLGTSHHKIGNIGLGPIVCSESVVAHSVKVFNINIFASHGLDLRGGLEPAKKCARLISPLSSIFIYVVRSVSEVGKSRGIFRRGIHGCKSVKLEWNILVFFYIIIT
jgi:hypothetical protein